MKLRQVTALVLFASMANTAMAYEDKHPLVIEDAPAATPPAAEQVDDDNAMESGVANTKPIAAPSDEAVLSSTAEDDPDSEALSPIDAPGEIPNLTPIVSPIKQTIADRAKEVAKIYREKVKPIYGFHTPEENVVALGNAENHPNPICLGAKRGNPCPVSSAGAKGSFQVKDDTGIPIWNKIRKNPSEAYDPENIEQNMAVAIAYLESMEAKHGADMYRAYNGGAAIQKESGRPNYDKPGPVREKTLAYSKRVNDYIPIFRQLLGGGFDLNAISASAPMTARALPLPRNAGTITGIVGDRRAYSGKVWDHKGMDIMTPVGTELRAIRGCKVVAVGWNKSGGVGSPGFKAGDKVIMNCGNGTPMTLSSVRYFHMQNSLPAVGTVLNANDLIGKSGESGGKTGKIDDPHLHIETWIWGANGQMIPDNPCNWFDCSSYASTSPLYAGPTNTSYYRASKARFEKMDREYLQAHARR